ncbi:MAG: bifunctional riboflavin kinase/FAD synthetase [Actinomycetota bacterium]|nr:bifunctional riboflavin kinase/FAD synthetase [Actinomycetota bacterium]
MADTEPRPRKVAVGEFDGVHLGHREVIRGADTVLTFDPHPVAVVRPEVAPKLLTSLPVKADLVASLGVQEMVVVPFDADFAAQTPGEFIEDVLVRRLQATHVAVGENFRFGRKAAGDAALLAQQRSFATRVVPLVEADDEVVSSTHIRGLVVAGEVDDAARFLGAPFQLRGRVVEGDRRGRELGYPTANIVPDDAIVCPGYGVYACLADDRAAAVNVGVRPTFDTGRGVLIEAFILDYEGDLYGHVLRLEFLERLRGERRFDDVDALIEQMGRDVVRARAVVRRSASVSWA